MPETQPSARADVRIDRLAARAAVWGTACLQGHASPDLAAERITADGPPQRLRFGDAGAERESWPVALARWAAAGASGLRLSLPVPGDVAGVPGPAQGLRAALAAGAALLVADAAPVLLVPRASPAEVLWEVLGCEPAPPARTTLDEAERAMRQSLREAAEALAQLEVARWPAGPDAGGAPDLLEALRGGGLDGEPLPPTYPPAAIRTAAQARRLRAVCALALRDEGGAVARAEADERRARLRELESAARVAEMAACNVLLEPAPRARG